MLCFSLYLAFKYARFVGISLVKVQAALMLKIAVSFLGIKVFYSFGVEDGGCEVDIVGVSGLKEDLALVQHRELGRLPHEQTEIGQTIEISETK